MITKPLADSELVVEEMMAAADEAGVVNMMSLSKRFSDSCHHLGHLSRDGYFGEFYYARYRSVYTATAFLPGISASLKKGGGAFQDMGVHALDAVWWGLGTPNRYTLSALLELSLVPTVEALVGAERTQRRFFSSLKLTIYQFREWCGVADRELLGVSPAERVPDGTIWYRRWG